jgi:hypothetical protein
LFTCLKSVSVCDSFLLFYWVYFCLFYLFVVCKYLCCFFFPSFNSVYLVACLLIYLIIGSKYCVSFFFLLYYSVYFYFFTCL